MLKRIARRLFGTTEPAVPAQPSKAPERTREATAPLSTARPVQGRRPEHREKRPPRPAHPAQQRQTESRTVESRPAPALTPAPATGREPSRAGAAQKERPEGSRGRRGRRGRRRSPSRHGEVGNQAAPAEFPTSEHTPAPAEHAHTPVPADNEVGSGAAQQSYVHPKMEDASAPLAAASPAGEDRGLPPVITPVTPAPGAGAVQAEPRTAAEPAHSEPKTGD